MLRFGLVSFPVEAFNAHIVEQNRVPFHQLHAECHSRIRYEKTCPIHGPITKSEIVSGYETSKGRYVELDPDELDSLRTEKERALTVDAFISPDQLDFVYLDGRMYYLSPDGEQAREPYGVFLAALDHLNRWGIGQVIFSGKEQVVLLRPYQGALHMAMLNYEAEIRDPAQTVAAVPEFSSTDKKVRLAEQLLESWTEEEFDFSNYKDTYQEKVRELIDAKVKGQDLVEPETEEEPEVVNFMEALRKSIGRSSRPAHAASVGKEPKKRRTRRRAS